MKIQILKSNQVEYDTQNHTNQNIYLLNKLNQNYFHLY